MLFDSWASLGRTVLSGVIAYITLIAVLRISGKRTLSKMNAFDLVVTVALGSTLATVLVSRQTPVADGVAALLLLVALQFAVAWTSVRLPRFEKFVKSEPTALLVRGRLLRDALQQQRVAESEIMAAVRSAGIARLEDAGLVVLETDGSFSVIGADALPAGQAILGGMDIDVEGEAELSSSERRSAGHR
jgi:uncharacterized membrane protein YcaP (DUF421 family)